MQRAMPTPLALSFGSRATAAALGGIRRQGRYHLG